MGQGLTRVAGSRHQIQFALVYEVGTAKQIERDLPKGFWRLFGSLLRRELRRAPPSAMEPYHRSSLGGVRGMGVNFEWNLRPEGASDNSPAQNAGFSTRDKRWSPKCFFCLACLRDARFRVPLAIQTTKYRAYLRHAYVFLRSLPRQWNCRATIVRPYGTKIQDLMLTPIGVRRIPPWRDCQKAPVPTSSQLLTRSRQRLPSSRRLWNSRFVGPSKRPRYFRCKPHPGPI
jgi:hypothetical protein